MSNHDHFRTENSGLKSSNKKPSGSNLLKTSSTMWLWSFRNNQYVVQETEYTWQTLQTIAFGFLTLLGHTGQTTEASLKLCVPVNLTPVILKLQWLLIKSSRGNWLKAYFRSNEVSHTDTARIQFQALIIDYITILVPVSLKLRNNRF